jgi:hypothetical protein
MEQEELRKLIEDDKRNRETEYLALMNEAAKRLRISVMAVIEAEGSHAIARVVVRAE